MMQLSAQLKECWNEWMWVWDPRASVVVGRKVWISGGGPDTVPRSSPCPITPWLAKALVGQVPYLLAVPQFPHLKMGVVVVLILI